MKISIFKYNFFISILIFMRNKKREKKSVCYLAVVSIGVVQMHDKFTFFVCPVNVFSCYINSVAQWISEHTVKKN